MSYSHVNNFRLLPPALSTSATRILFKKMTPTKQGLLAIIYKLLLQIQIYRKKAQGLVFISQV